MAAEPPQSNEQLASSLAALEQSERDIVKMAKAMLDADGGNLFPVDIFVTGALKRALSLSSGLRLLIEHRNLMAARALLRMQIDTVARLSAVWLVEEPHAFVMKVLGGTPIRDLHGQDGKRLTDRYLIDSLGKEYEWIPRVYETTCGYVHLSEHHVFGSVQSVDGGDRTIAFGIYPDDQHMPEQSFVEVVDCARETTQILLQYVHGWAFTKANPALVAEAKKRRDRGMDTPTRKAGE